MGRFVAFSVFFVVSLQDVVLEAADPDLREGLLGVGVFFQGIQERVASFHQVRVPQGSVLFYLPLPLEIYVLQLLDRQISVLFQPIPLSTHL